MVKFSSQEMDSYLMDSIVSKEKEFIINPQDDKYREWVNNNHKDFTVIVRRIK